MSQVCGCGRCYGCRLAWEAGEFHDTTEVEARENAWREAEEQERAEQLECYWLAGNQQESGNG